MRIVELTACIVELPLRREITHASATRHQSTNVLVRCRLSDGAEGWGEGVPRPYVTGETPEGALQQLAGTPLEQQLNRDCGSWRDVIQLCDAFQPTIHEPDPRGHRANALRCAVELSILDAFGRHFAEPVSELVRQFAPAKNIYAPRESVRYSTAITAEGDLRERLSALKMRLFGFRECKVKVGMPGADDAMRLRRIRSWIGRRMDLRVDANEAWRTNELSQRLEALLPYGVSCVEQPVPHDELEALAKVRSRLPVPIMLDESLTSLADARRAIALGACDFFNIRLSKCGGFLASLRLAVLAHQSGLGYQLGCHPGETGVLSAAGRHWAANVRGVRYLEGSYDRHLLSELVTCEDLTFGYGGKAPALRAPGLGVTVDRRVLSRLIRNEATWRWS